MQRDLGYSYAQIAGRLGKSKGYVQNRMRLLQLDADLQQIVAERPDTLSHAYELAKVADPQQRRALIDVVRRDALSLAEARARVQAALTPGLFHNRGSHWDALLPAEFSVVSDLRTPIAYRTRGAAQAIPRSIAQRVAALRERTWIFP
ncbi:MAG: hypothetical protein HGA45_35020 [Chloroflexales bacterium]|nr:hypothetical protein [Chloroflexales bacterium]